MTAPSEPDGRHPTTPWYCPRVWCGMQPSVWFRLLSDHRFQIDNWGWAMATTLTTLGALALDPIQSALFRRRSQLAPLVDDPLFIIGHWRCGTTLVQRLMSADDRFACPSVYQCFAPRSFLISEPWMKTILGPLLPKRRPMDNVPLGWDEPMEDEFALMTMGQRTVYRRIAFPNENTQDLDWINMQSVDAERVEQWKACLQEFAQYLNLRFRKRLLFKSPPHTARIRLLLEKFPKAKFLHVVRDPRAFIPSTIHMWAALDSHHALQKPRHDKLQAFVFEAFHKLYEEFDRDGRLPNRGQFAEVRYEELVKDKLGVMQRAYEQLELDGFEEHTRPGLLEETSRSIAYQANDHRVSATLMAEIEKHCASYCQRFGYVETKRTAAATFSSAGTPLLDTQSIPFNEPIPLGSSYHTNIE